MGNPLLPSAATGRHLPHGITVLPATWHKWTCHNLS